LDDFTDNALSLTQQAINVVVHSTTKESPGAFVVFQHNMLCLFSALQIGKLHVRRPSRADMVHRNLLCENSCHHPFDWQPGKETLIEAQDETRNKTTLSSLDFSQSLLFIPMEILLSSMDVPCSTSTSIVSSFIIIIEI
jgi:hypothetical protein